MADQSDSGVAVSAASGAGVGGHRVVSTGARLLSGSLFFSQVLDLFLSCLELSLEHAAPFAAVSCYALPALSVDIQSFHVALADILVAQLGTADRSLAR